MKDIREREKVVLSVLEATRSDVNLLMRENRLLLAANSKLMWKERGARTACAAAQKLKFMENKENIAKQLELSDSDMSEAFVSLDKHLELYTDDEIDDSISDADLSIYGVDAM